MTVYSVYSLRSLSKTYSGQNRIAYDDSSFDVQPGEIFGLLGDNGAGKSTLAKWRAGAIRERLSWRVERCNSKARSQPVSGTMTMQSNGSSFVARLGSQTIQVDYAAGGGRSQSSLLRRRDIHRRELMGCYANPTSATPAVMIRAAVRRSLAAGSRKMTIAATTPMTILNWRRATT